MTGQVMKVSRNGQVSIPAATRARWQTERVVVVDLGDRLVVRPLPHQPVAAMVGKYRRRGPSTSRVRSSERADDARRERRKTS